MKIAALIAAAGLSSRMKTSKALLKWNDRSFIEHLIRAFSDGGVSMIMTTLEEGPDCQPVREAIQFYPVEAIRNRFPLAGLLGSVQSALQQFGSDIDALLVCPVDVPFVTAELVKRMLAQLEKSATIVVAAHRQVYGHPIAFSHHMFAPLMGLKPGEGPDQLLAKYRQDVVLVDWIDNRILCNINTPEDYAFFCPTKPS